VQARGKKIMAKKKAQRKGRNQVVAKVTGGALPSPICFSAGRAIGGAEARLNHLKYELDRGSAREEILESAQGVGVAFGAIGAEFPLTDKTLKPLREKFFSKTLKDAKLKEAVRQGLREIADLKRKAQIGCNVPR
jgi:hypothetical protein